MLRSFFKGKGDVWRLLQVRILLPTALHAVQQRLR